MDFFDMHCHSFYSPMDGLDSPDTLVKRGKEIGLAGLSITDHGVCSSHREMLKAGIEHDFPIALGLEGYFSGSDDRFDRRSKAKRQDGDSVYNHIIIIAKNDNGLKNLYAMQEKAYMESFYQKSIIDLELLSEYGDDLIISSACVSGLIARNLINDNEEKAIYWARRFKDRFEGDFYIELQSHNDDISAGLNQKLLDLADTQGIKPIISTDTHFANPEDKWIEDALLILNTNPKKNPDFDYTKMEKMNIMEKYNYIYPERQMTFEKIDVFLQNYETLNKEMLRRGYDRQDLFSNTIEVANKIGAK